MRDLPEGVHARVRTARAMNHHLFLHNFLRGIGYRALNRREARLDLPAVKIRAVVSDCDLDISHRCAAIMARGHVTGIEEVNGERVRVAPNKEKSYSTKRRLRVRSRMTRAGACRNSTGVALRAIVRLVAGDS